MCNSGTATTNQDGTISVSGAPSLALPGNVQSGWRWCARCQGLYLAGASLGICPVRPKSQGGVPAMVFGPHTQAGSGTYGLFLANASGCVQTGWRRCASCRGLFFGEGGRAGKCPAKSGGHTVAPESYQIHTCDAQGGQPGWRWCKNCEGMFHAAGDESVCPAGGAHDGSASGTYFIPWWS